MKEITIQTTPKADMNASKLRVIARDMTFGLKWEIEVEKYNAAGMIIDRQTVIFGPTEVKEIIAGAKPLDLVQEKLLAATKLSVKSVEIKG